MRCKPHKECRQRNETEMVICSLHNRRRNIHQMKEVRKGIFECLPQFACRGQFSDSTAAASTAPVPVSAPASYVLPPKGSRPQQAPGEARFTPSVNVAWAPTSNRARNVGLVTSNDWVQTDHKTWCARHGKLTSQCELIKDCCHVCYDASLCLSTPLELPADLSMKGCKELLCSKHNTLRLVEFLERTLDKMGYICVAGHRCRGTLINQQEVLSERDAHPTKEVVSSFFV
ncbi:hypothetical protein DQ04_00321200 [Trypanosoma grayi]|uniref:hypothetical protein n=1 Tax=Trypanosoma grayi TaxID=71804 RepID=UPI0004F43CF5|nr:hypothetical protein DQ04_00321200 [Trypanosoma grayi]KEG14751.1 hypothetical protein DQ04_00321200 [Trypanosoma grayi]